MSQYLPEVAWSTIASNVTLGASAYRYYITVNPLDPNEAGASTMTVAINDWFIDFAGYPFLIENVAGSVLTVYDILERGDGVVSAYAPYANKLGYVYRPLNGAIILTQAQLRKLDASAADIIQPIEKGIQWNYRGVRLVSVDDDYTNITKLYLSKNLTYSYTENDGWQGGNSAEIDINISLGTGAKSEVAYTNNGDGTLTIQTTNFALYDNALGTGYPNIYTVNGSTVSFTDNVYNYVVVNYNSGTPILQVITDVTLINETTIIPVFSVLRRSTVLCITDWYELGNAKIDKLHQSIVKTQRYRRESGLSISIPSTGTPRRVSLTGGVVWIGAVDIVMDSITSGDVGVTMFEYYKTSGTWGYSLATQLNNTYYQGTTDRITLTSNRYAVAFVYRGVDSNKHLYFVYGTGDYTLSQAQASSVPSDLPIAIRSHTILVGRVIIQKSSDSITELASAFDTAFTIQPIDNHAGLSNLPWTSSGHTGTNFSIPNFSAIGVTTEIAPNTTTTRKYLSMLGDGTNGALPTWEEVTGGSGTPGGSDTFVQFNYGGSFGGTDKARIINSAIHFPFDDGGWCGTIYYNEGNDNGFNIVHQNNRLHFNYVTGISAQTSSTPRMYLTESGDLTISNKLFAGLSNTLTTNKVYFNSSTKELSYRSDAFAALTDGATVTWDCATGLNKTLTTSRSTMTISITNVSNGMKGDLIVFTTTTCTITVPFGYEGGGMVIQDYFGDGSTTGITFLADLYTSIVGWRLKWSYDGTRYYYEGSYLRNESGA